MQISRRDFLTSALAMSKPFKLSSKTGEDISRHRVVMASDFGVLPGSSDAGPGLTRALLRMALQGGGRLLISPGVYRFSSKMSVAILLSESSNIHIEAEEVTFIFSDLVRPIIFKACHDVCIYGLTIDWARPPFSQGDVVEVATDRQSAVICLDAVTPMDGWTHIKAIGEYDRASGLITRRGLDAYDVVSAIEALGPNLVRLDFQRPITIKVNSTVVLRHAVYDAHAFEFRGCANIRLERVTVHSAPGMAFVGNRSENITLSHCTVAPKPRSGLFMSTTADGAHFGDCSGDIVIDSCRFAAMGDDGVNVNTAYWRILERLDERTVIVSKWRDARFANDETPLLGDLFEFASAATLEVLGEARVETSSLNAPASAVHKTLVFAGDVPASVRAGDYVLDEARSPKTLIRNCRFENNRARGVLAHKNTRIENSAFYNQSAQGVILSPDGWWMEGPEIENVGIVGNTFDGIDRWELGLGAIYVDAAVVGPDGRARPSTGRPNHKILITDNVFRNFAGPEVMLRATGL